MTRIRHPSCTPQESARWVVAQLVEAGHQALYAGGCVRDRLSGREPKDYDIATDAHPEAVRAVFPNAHRVGEAFGVMLVRHGGQMVEVATFRIDGPYHDGRRPDGVEFTCPEEDARRRDFTINGLFEDPETGEIHDYVGGQADLAEGIIRAIGDPAARIREDRLRMLRAVRFAARFGFLIESGTAEAIRATAAELKGVSRERIGHELRWMLAAPTRTAAVGLLQDLRLDGAALDELPVREAGGMRPLSHLSGLPAAAAFATALAAWMLDRHDIPAGTDLGRERGAEELARGVRRWTDALVLSSRESVALNGALEAYEILCHQWAGRTIAQQKRQAAAESFGPALELVRSNDPRRADEIGAEVARLALSGLAPEPLLTGDNLISDGFVPGPRFKGLLDEVYDAQLEDRVRTLKDALALARSLAGSGDSGGTAPT